MYSVLIRMHRRIFRWFILPVIILITASCATITSNDLIQENANFVQSNQRFEGTVKVQFAFIMTLPSWSRHPFLNAFTLKEAVEKAITKTNLFTRVEQQKADYILDIWMDKQSVKIPMLSLGEYAAGVFSIWRLTRVSDGKVLVCDFVDGRGTINDRGFAPSKRSMIAAIKHMIHNGVVVLSDRSNVHLSALSIAGSRSSIGPWVANVRQNWPKLRAGMTLPEVESIIGPVRSGGAVLDYVETKTKGVPLGVIIQDLYKEGLLVEGDLRLRPDPKWITVRKDFDLITTRLTSPVVTAIVEADGSQVVKGVYPVTSFDTISWDSLDMPNSKEGIVSLDFQCRSAIYTLVFLDEKLAHWNLH